MKLPKEENTRKYNKQQQQLTITEAAAAINDHKSTAKAAKQSH